MNPALLALAAGAFGIGSTEFVIMGLLLQVAADFDVTIAQAGLLISGYALGVAVGAPLLTLASRRLPRKTVLLALMGVFIVGNAACALAPGYGWLMAARVVTALAHGTFFGVGSVVATGLVPPERRASAIALMFSGLTMATLLGVPAGAWLGLQHGWRSTFWAVTAIGLLALLVIAVCVPRDRGAPQPGPLRDEFRAVLRLPVLLGLGTTVLGFGGVFAVFTYVQPLLTRVTGVADASVSSLLLVFGGGLAVGNLLGGRLADRLPRAAVPLSLMALAAMLALTLPAFSQPWSATLHLAAFGVAAFATAAPMQWRVLEATPEAGRNLASSLNIAAFNLGNALGAWAGGMVIDHGPGLSGLGLAAAGLTLGGLALSLLGGRRPAGAGLATAAAEGSR